MSKKKKKLDKKIGTAAGPDDGPKKWIASSDLRLIPDSVLAKTTNQEFNPEAFRVIAAKLSETPSCAAIYGLNEFGAIQEAVILTFSFIDNCIYVDNSFGANLTNEGLREVLKKEAERSKASGAKLIYTAKLFEV